MLLLKYVYQTCNKILWSKYIAFETSDFKGSTFLHNIQMVLLKRTQYVYKVSIYLNEFEFTKYKLNLSILWLKFQGLKIIVLSKSSNLMYS
jgi:hypothetical protein